MDGSHSTRSMEQQSVPRREERTIRIFSGHYERGQISSCYSMKPYTSINPMRDICLLPQVPCCTVLHSKLSRCQFLKNQPVMWLVSLNVCQSFTAEKKPIASSDTAWQYCLKGCRRMPDSTGQLTVNLSIISCTCHDSLSAIIPV